MLGLIEPIFERVGMEYVRLDGSVPQKKRQVLVHQFQNDAKCRAIIMSNAGSTGLNLQSANTVINVDLPWNPAVLEQRIARAHRMGQKQPVQVYMLVTEDTMEERLLGHGYPRSTTWRSPLWMWTRMCQKSSCGAAWKSSSDASSS